ncbi:cytochrome P450 CYP12A2 isoform X1 [Bombyx mori]|uniref:Cytochrome P450 n=2 Tax=Bombyx mori TaxID=7091 RepID=A0A8R1WKU8_BOMMO|nr:cytochrome P450 CYP12A2 isoform X1 [Bombyx mori]
MYSLNKSGQRVFALQIHKRYHYANGKFSTFNKPKPFESIPGLGALPLIGPLHHFLPIIGTIGPKTNMFDVLGILEGKFGPLVKVDGVFARGTMLFLFEPDHFEQVYRAEEANPLRPGFQVLDYYRTQLRKSRYGGLHGLINAQGPEWREFRTKVNPALLLPKLVKLYAPGIDEIAQDFVQRLSQITHDDAYIKDNFELELTKFSLEATALVALGSRLGCLKDSLDSDHPARRLMKSTRDIFELTYKLEIRPSPWRYIATPAYKMVIEAYDTQWEISMMYINHARKKLEQRGYDIPEEEKSVLEKLIAIDEKVAVMMASEMLLAGIDTVSFVTTSLLFNLAMNQKVQDKLREEIRTSESNYKRYFRACLKEALRLRHVVPANLRRTHRDHIVGGYYIPKGIDVIAPNEYLSRSEKFYPQPEEFIPERWLVEKSDPLYYGNAHPLVTLPFGFGVRSCIGRRIAELEIELLIKRLIEEFKVTWNGPPIKIVNKLTNTFVKPYNFTFTSVK